MRKTSLEQKRENGRRYYHEVLKTNPKYKERQALKYRQNQKAYYRVNRKSILKNKYNLTWEEYEEMFEEQNGVCAICKGTEEGRMLAVDHNHTTGEVRGLLCGSCNRALGLFKDDPKLLEIAKEYVS